MNAPQQVTPSTDRSLLTLKRAKSPDGPLSADFLRELATRFGLTAFVETGTYLGNTAAVANTIFAEVHTIELSAQLASQAATRFANEPRVRVYEGDSASLLAQLVPHLKGPALFWLDGHYSEGVTARGQGNTPILEELKAIASSGRKDSVILIDDLRLFERRALAVDSGSSLHGYPSVNEVHEAILAIDPSYQFFVYGDVALAFPAASQVEVSPLVLALTVSRLFNGSNLPIAEVLAAEGLIGQARGEERDVLRELPSISSAVEPYGLGLHYRLWRAETLLGEDKFLDGCREMLELVRLNFPHWRIKWYLAVAIHFAGDNAMACEILDELIQTVPNFTPAAGLRAALTAPKVAPTPATAATSESQRPTLTPAGDALKELQGLGLAGANRPLKLHLGCGEQHFDGYVNIDYPPSEHSCQTRIGADVFADITKLHFAPQSVDEIRLHHVFEHFKRSEALALIIRWHESLKVGGRLHLETPDFDGCCRQLVSNIPLRYKQAVLRHCFGSQEAGWANHYDGWSEERFHHVLSQFGFNVQSRSSSWSHPPHLANVEAVATKTRTLSRADLLAAADRLLSEYTVAEVPSEQAMCEVWRKAMRDFLALSEPKPQPAAAPVAAPKPNWPALVRELPIVADLPLTKDIGFDNDNPETNGEHHLLRAVIHPGDVVFDVGANVGDWSLHVLAAQPNVNLHAFEPFADTFAVLERNLADTPVTLHALALAECDGQKMFHHYVNRPDFAGMNSCYRRPEVEQRLNAPTATTAVPAKTLDTFCAENAISQINFLKIDTEGSELDVLRGASGLLAAHRIGAVQFEYGGTYRDAGITLRETLAHVAKYGYIIFRIAPDGLVHIGAWHNELESYRYANYLAVAPVTKSIDPKPTTKKPITQPAARQATATAAKPATCGVVFSKDRAMQLDATLKSFFGCCTDASSAALNVIYASSDKFHEDQYRELAREYPTVNFVREKNFRADFLARIAGAPELLLLVDDNIFVKPFCLADARAALEQNEDAIGFSLRLGRNTTHCYPLDRAQSVPEFKNVAPGVAKFFWLHAEGDFGYPLEVSSSLYRSRDLVPVLAKAEFSNPNSLEGQLAYGVARFRDSHPTLLCFEQSVTFCNPVNKVQTVAAANRAGNQDDYSASNLSMRFAAGQRINIGAFTGFVPRGCHQEAELAFTQDTRTSTHAPAVSVIIGCHNYEEFLPGAVESVLNQTFRDFEIIIVDDGSTDNSLTVAKRLASANNSEIPIRIFHLENVGPAATRRYAIEQSRGRYYLPLDADDKIAPQYLEKTVPELEADQKLGFAYVDTVYFGDTQQHIRQPEYDFSKLCANNFISYCSLVRRAAFDAIDGYDRANWGYYEDWDLWIRLGQAGWHGKHVAEPLFFYHHHFGTSLSFYSLRLDPIYRAYLVSQHPEIYPPATMAEAKKVLAEMPAGWHAVAPLREVAPIEKLLAQHPDNRHLLFFLAIAHFRVGKVNNAVKVLNDLLAKHPQDEQARQALKQFSAEATRAPQSDTAKAPLVSVIVPTYNRPHMLPETLQSILRQSFQDFEIVVVNDCGAGVSELVNNLNGSGKIRYLKHERNRGLAAARNTGIKAARGKYIAYLDDDDIFLPDHLKTLVEFLENSNGDVAYTDSYRAHQRKNGATLEIFQRDIPYSFDFDYDRILVDNFVPVLCFMHRKSCWDAAGGFDESLPVLEDWDLWIRMSRLFDFAHIAKVTCEFRWRTDGSTMTVADSGKFPRAREIIAAKRASLPARRAAVASARPKVSIIILTLNQWWQTKLCLESIARFTPQSHELIMVDNGSSDETVANLREYAAHHTNVRVIVNRGNRGFAAGNNLGLALARGENVLLLNNDTVVTEGWLERMLAVFDRHPQTGIVGPVSNYVSGPQLVPQVTYKSLDGLPAFAAAWSSAHAGQSAEAVRLVGFCLLARRAVIDRIGGLDEQFGSGNFEDDDFCLRARLSGFQARIAQDSFVHHTGSQTFKGEKIDYSQAMQRNWNVFRTKWGIKEATAQGGYVIPNQFPANFAVKVALPTLDASHRTDVSQRWWEETTSTATQPAAKPATKKTVTVELPTVGKLGWLNRVNELFAKKDLRGAWEAGLVALKERPFHPEAYLRLGEIALIGGNPALARECVERARALAPEWKPAKKFLKSIPTNSKPAKLDWTPLPEVPAKPRLSVCLIVKNEERFLGQCLKSVRGIAHEIIVVDTGSTDRTVEIAREHGAKIYTFKWDDNFSHARNAALERATGDWILFLDADEELTPEAVQTLAKEMSNPNVIAYRLPLHNAGMNEVCGGYVPRLYRNAPGLFYHSRVHEQVYPSILVRAGEWKLAAELGTTRIIHHGYEDELVRSRGKAERNLKLLKLAVEEWPGEPNLLMNFGLELARSDRREEGLVQYRAAFDAMSTQSMEEYVPELREVLLTQYAFQLLQAGRQNEAVEVLHSKLARLAPLTASHHFLLGLAYLDLKQFEKGAEQFRQCLSKRKQPVLSPVVRDIVKSGPHHCLALCLSQLKQTAAADKAFRDALAEGDDSRALRFDYARFLFEQGGEPLEALKLAHELVVAKPDDGRTWLLGGAIALSRPDYLEFARDWTAEAMKNFPTHAAVVTQRAEALLLSGDVESALPLWRQIAASQNPAHLAALAVCELASGETLTTISKAEQNRVSQAFIGWYRRLLACGAQSVLMRINERAEQLRFALPAAGQTICAAMDEAEPAPAA